MATRLDECKQLIEVSERNQRQIHICHVLRYTQHARKMREIVQSGVLGEIIDVDHRENVSFWHMAHSYVRGNWRNSQQSSPMILAKCCHDLDILPWILNQWPVSLSSKGELTHFRADKAPVNTPERCVENCPIEKECPYSAIHIYVEMIPFWYSYKETCTNVFHKAIIEEWTKKSTPDSILIASFSIFEANNRLQGVAVNGLNPRTDTGTDLRSNPKRPLRQVCLSLR